MAFEQTLENLFLMDSLEWIFVGGKGGVGKTTVACSLATLFANRGFRTLLVSTDPAHNLCDAFGQTLGSEPSKIDGIDNLYAVEADLDKGMTSDPLMSALSDLPMAGECVGMVMMDNIDSLEFQKVVWDTAPTGHTLGFLRMPATFSNLSGGSLFGSLLKTVSGAFFGESAHPASDLPEFSRLHAKLTDSSVCQFVVVGIPSFLSLYESERMIQSLAEMNVDVSHVVINQVLATEDCATCRALSNQQHTYIERFYELYADLMHVIMTPLRLEEVRGVDSFIEFSASLLSQDERLSDRHGTADNYFASLS